MSLQRASATETQLVSTDLGIFDRIVALVSDPKVLRKKVEEQGFLDMLEQHKLDTPENILLFATAFWQESRNAPRILPDIPKEDEYRVLNCVGNFLLNFNERYQKANLNEIHRVENPIALDVNNVKMQEFLRKPLDLEQSLSDEELRFLNTISELRDLEAIRYYFSRLLQLHLKNDPRVKDAIRGYGHVYDGMKLWKNCFNIPTTVQAGRAGLAHQKGHLELPQSQPKFSLLEHFQEISESSSEDSEDQPDLHRSGTEIQELADKIEQQVTHLLLRLHLVEILQSIQKIEDLLESK